MSRRHGRAALSVTSDKTESIYGRYNILREAEQDEALAKVKAALPRDLVQA